MNMRQLHTIFTVLLIASYGTYAQAEQLCGRSFFSPRSQSVNGVLDLVGWQQYINKFDTGCLYGAFAITPEYTDSFHPEKLAQYFFGTNKLTFSGSASTLRGSDDILADYFGLPTDFKSTVVFTPTVSNFIVDLHWYIGFDGWIPGSYMRIHAPLVYARWNMDLCENIQEKGSNPYIAGYMASGEVARTAMYASVKQSLHGDKTVGDREPIQYGIVCGAQTRTRFSDIQIIAGYNPVCAEKHHFGLNARLSLPTGNRSRAEYFFEPMVGNGGHWEAGVGFTGHGIFWESEAGDKSFGLYADFNLTHLFDATERRSLDLDGSGTFSRYMLLADMGNPVVEGLELNVNTVLVPAEQQYHARLVPAINVTTLDVDVNVAVQADLTVKLAYCYKNCSIDLGYELWARTAEKMSCRQAFPNNRFAIKGDAQMYGFEEPADTVYFVALNATESDATIYAGQGAGNANFTNDNVDNAQQASFRSEPLYVDVNDPETRVHGSAQAILLKNCDLDDLSCLSPSAITQKFFVHLSYGWPAEKSTVAPFLGAGASVEVDSSDKKTRSALSQWAVWVKAGFYC